MKYTIDVTQEDIDNGEPNDGCSCPIALALERATQNERYSVDEYCIKEWEDPDSDSEWVAGLPSEAVRFVSDFDMGKPVSPFSFEIELPEAPCP